MMTRTVRIVWAVLRWSSLAVWAVLIAVALPLVACRDGSDPVAPADDGGAGLPATGHTTPYHVSDAQASNKADHEASGDYTWAASSAGSVTCGGGSIQSGGSGATVSGTTLTIKSAGTYVLSGSLAGGQVVVNASGALVRLVLSGLDLASARGAPIVVSSAGKTVLLLADNTVNRLADAATRASGDDAVGAIFSADDLSVGGDGALTVVGSYEDGIVSKDGLVIRSGRITVSAKDDGIRGNDYVVIRGGKLEVTAAGDGVKTSNEEDAALGYVLVESGSLTVTSGLDALEADTDLLLTSGTLSLNAGGGSSKTFATTLSAKAVKAGVALVADGGTVTVDAADD
ncbi:MAG: carbohydrate-binding domain-containing protein, partial [Gemmatimonadetes bacterium]|nr:carbohydrate-binding domain-containing protein [Gemmatimonadota bacterium]